MKRSIVAVIVTYNRLEKLRVALANSLANAFYRIIVVDNCSSDGTTQWLKGFSDPRLIVVHTEKNLGGAGGFNLGFRYAAEQLPEADWMVCFDDDAYPEQDVATIFERLEIPDTVGGIAGAVFLPDGGISEMNRPSVNPFWHLREFFLTPFKGRYGFHLADSDYLSENVREIDASSFVGFFVRLSLIRESKIGLPRSELFIYADDIIYVLEMRKSGTLHWFVPQLKFHHDCQTLRDQKDVYHPLWRVYYTFRNRLEMYRVASGFFYPFVLLIKIPKCFLAARHYDPDERRRFLQITARAVWDGITRNYSMSHDQVVALASDSR
jgi:rhamnopyranosyl-N-acetylglucosaminyl-diphospho-decaprenol beta-1,3/1,4-galactofuranosyltransferase